MDERLLVIENKKRKSKGEPLLEELEETLEPIDPIAIEDKDDEENKDDEKEKEPDYQVIEAGNILLDYIELQNAKKIPLMLTKKRQFND